VLVSQSRTAYILARRRVRGTGYPRLSPGRWP